MTPQIFRPSQFEDITKFEGKIAVSDNPVEKLTRFADFVRWEARCIDYVRGFDAKAQSGAILALLDDEFYDLAHSANLSAASTPSVVLDGLREILRSSEHPWVLQSDFKRRFQQLGESINNFQQALRLLGRRIFSTVDATALNTRVLEHFIAGVLTPNLKGPSSRSAVGLGQGPHPGS
ncbi:unnamed protein product [Schistocephalus solidus]|uniref:Uncharacterized protein n=1 Tax=Schistocephalus solidus TaxID=70667 RepID=A0A183TFZ4_SCHSO|nr:unnamed protein product [Schistocephalus solidus]